ncbi:MAG: glycosyltransferase [Bacteroidales bacterium]|nr:glycosyltransferase [Bacteroidales bacterium]
MKILYVITSLRTGGAEKLVVQLSEFMKNRGHEVEVALFDGEDAPFKRELEASGVKVHSFGVGKSVYSPKMLFSLKKLIKEGGYDIVHTHNSSPQIFAAVSKAMIGGKKTKYIHTEHNTTGRRRTWYFRAIDRWTYGKFARNICISDKAYDNLAAHLNSKKIALQTIKNGADISRLVAAEPEPELREGCPRNVVVMVAAFRPQKDQDTLVRAMRLLGDDYCLWLVGGDQRLEEVKALAKELSLDGRVRFFGVRTDVPQILKTADVVVMSSHYEGLSLSSIEGMAVGKPFIASDVDGLREIVSGAGILFPEGDDKALASEIEKVCSDSDYAKKVAESCLERAWEYDFGKMALAYENVYKEVLR